MTTVLKLGGSLLTDKASPETVDDDALVRAADTIADAAGTPPTEELLLVHGGGSFGHPAAAEHGLSEHEGSTDPAALADVHAAMARLADRVLRALREAGVPALPVQPLSVARRTEEGRLELPAEPVETMLAEGFVPVTHGDVVAHAGRGGTVLSGDELAVEFARALDADRVGLCATVPGVLDGQNRVVDRVDSYDAVADLFEGSDATDVTGGMAGKVQALLAADRRGSIFGLEGLKRFLAGESPGTTVK